MDYYERGQEAAAAVQPRIGQRAPQVGIVRGSGLGDFAGTLADQVSIPYGDLPHWPASNVIGHEGRLVVGTVKGKMIAALAGRCHLYEGHDARTVTFATRVLGLIGVK